MRFLGCTHISLVPNTSLKVIFCWGPEQVILSTGVSPPLLHGGEEPLFADELAKACLPQGLLHTVSRHSKGHVHAWINEDDKTRIESYKKKYLI